jgi:hypothetical protein
VHSLFGLSVLLVPAVIIAGVWSRGQQRLEEWRCLRRLPRRCRCRMWLCHAVDGFKHVPRVHEHTIEFCAPN